MGTKERGFKMKFIEQLQRINACPQSLDWVGDKTIEEAWTTCENIQWMLWILNKTDLDLIDPICAMVESVFYLVPKEHKQACSNAISAARRRASKDELYAAYDAAYDAAHIAALYAAYDNDNNLKLFSLANAANFAIRANALVSYYAVSRSAAADAARHAADAAYYACGSAAYRTEKKRQCDILRKHFTIDQVKEAFNKLVA
jgi:hypothetical protein